MKIKLHIETCCSTLPTYFSTLYLLFSLYDISIRKHSGFSITLFTSTSQQHIIFYLNQHWIDANTALPDSSPAAVQYPGSRTHNRILNTSCKSASEVYHGHGTFSIRLEGIHTRLCLHTDCFEYIETVNADSDGISVRYLQRIAHGGFVDVERIQTYIGVQSVNACSCLNTRDRTVYRPSYLCTRVSAKQICLLSVSAARLLENCDAKSSCLHWWNLIHCWKLGVGESANAIEMASVCAYRYRKYKWRWWTILSEVRFVVCIGWWCELSMGYLEYDRIY